MTLIKIINSEHSAEFGQLITDIRANVLSYLEARQKAQKERMIIIGKIAAYKSSYPQRSKEHRALTTAMSEEGWSQDVISNNLARSGLFLPLDRKSFIEDTESIVERPRFGDWRVINAQALVTGSTKIESDGRLNVSFRLWDTFAEQQMTGLV